MFRLFRLWKMARTDLPVLWFALQHPNRPLWLWPAVTLLGLYALDPFNFALPVLGFVDDLILLPLALHLLLKLLPAQIRAGLKR